MSIFKRSSFEEPWNDRDRALLHTCTIGATIVRQHGLESIAEVIASFPTTLGPDEPLWACGAYIAYEHCALGDGTYYKSNTVVAGTGPLGLGLLAASLTGSAISNSRAKNQAAADATPRWVPAHSGDIYIGPRGCYFQNPKVLPWGWDDIEESSMIEPGVVRWVGRSTAGQVAWLVQSGWAELVFLLWALNRHPRHPQLADGSWLPDGWIQRARLHDTRVSDQVLAIRDGR